MPWNEVTVKEQRENFIRDYRCQYYSVSELAERFGISRKTAYKWIGRWEQDCFLQARSPQSCKEIPQPRVGKKLLPHERVFHSVALSVEDQQMAIVNEPVNHGRGHRFIQEDVRPFAELKVCGEYQAALFVAG